MRSLKSVGRLLPSFPAAARRVLVPCCLCGDDRRVPMLDAHEWDDGLACAGCVATSPEAQAAAGRAARLAHEEGCDAGDVFADLASTLHGCRDAMERAGMDPDDAWQRRLVLTTVMRLEGAQKETS